MSEKVSNDAKPSPSAAWFRQQVDAVQADILAAVQRHYRTAGSQVIVHALVECSGRILAVIAAADPASRADIDSKLNDLRLFVATAEQRPQ